MILVSGGTGMVGSAIVKELLRRGEKVAVLGRDADKIRQAPRHRVSRCASAMSASRQRSPRRCRASTPSINAVQFPGSPVENRSKGFTFEEVDLKGTRHQVDAAKKAGVRRFVYISGVGAAKDAEKHWFRFKWEAENYLREERPRVGRRAADLGLRTRGRLAQPLPRPREDAAVHPDVRQRQAGHAARVHRRRRARAPRTARSSPKPPTSSSSSAAPT